MMMWTFEAADESDTERLGRALAAALPGGTVVALEGTLGAGKTRLVQAVARASGVPDEAVSSPTFVLINEYAGQRPIYHFDAYRLKDEDEFFDLGPEEYFASRGITLVEWAGRVERCLPTERLTIRIDVVGDTARRFHIEASAEYEDVVRKLIGDLETN